MARSLAGLLLLLVLNSTTAFALVGPAREAPDLEPYVVVVLNNDGGSVSYCSASVIAPNIILTAAHCVTSPEDTQVYFRDEQGKPVLVDINAIAINPGFRPDAARWRLLSVDLALLRLAEPLPARFMPVSLARTDRVSRGERFRIAGFGTAEEGMRGRGGVLRSGVVVADGPKSPVLLWVRDPNGTGLGACTGDSGGPIFSDDSTSLVAVAVWAKGDVGQRCGALTQAVLVAPQATWLERVLKAWDKAGTIQP